MAREGMESTAFTKVWLFLMLSVNAVIMICVRNCRISFTLIVLLPLLLLLAGSASPLQPCPCYPPGMHFDIHLKGINGDDGC